MDAMQLLVGLGMLMLLYVLYRIGLYFLAYAALFAAIGYLIAGTTGGTVGAVIGLAVGLYSLFAGGKKE